MFVDFVASDVPGVRVPVFLGGAPVRAQYAFGPTIGSAVNVTLLTYVDTCALGIDVDTTATPRRPIRAADRSRNGHKRISISATVWHNAVDRQIMAQCAFEDRSRNDARRTDSLPLWT
jgi:hypothetical protein